MMAVAVGAADMERLGTAGLDEPPLVRERPAGWFKTNSVLLTEASRKNRVAFPGVGACLAHDENNQPVNLHSYLFNARRRAGWTPSFIYDYADTDTWQKTLVEQEKSGMTTDWMKEPLRQPTQDFFDQRRLRELSTAGSETHRPTTSSASSRPPWGKLDGEIIPRSRPSTSGNVWFGDEDRHVGARHTGQEQDVRQSQKPVQLLPRYKTVGETPQDVYLATVHPKHIPSLDLARAGLKSAPAGLSAHMPALDTLRPVTQGSSRRPIVPKLSVPATRADHERLASAAPTERRAEFPSRGKADLSALPAPLQQALLEQASPQSGSVSSRGAPRVGWNLHKLHITTEITHDSFVGEHAGAEGDADLETAILPPPRPQLTRRQHSALSHSHEVVQAPPRGSD